ncbi:MAG TPA: hypothetical protein VMW56_29265 [Candidatus Margulisiibacteriota bacterium]|nr:hypothetical protein [Candidatus Margulisiibacteriota bacterium]
MKTSTSTGFWRYSLYTVLGLGTVAFTASCEVPAMLSGSPSSPVTQGRLSAGSVNGQAGHTVAVPITINTGTGNVAFFGVTFAVVAREGAPAIANKLTYKTAAGVPAPDLSTAVQAEAKLAIGYAGVTMSPPLSGTKQVGTLMVPIPAGAKGSYAVNLSKISGGDSKGNKVALAGEDGTITLGGGGGS